MKLLIQHRKIKNIPCLEVLPKDAVKQALPLIIFYHGWRSQKELLLTQARKLAQKNFRVILPDALNHGERKQVVSAFPALTFWQSIQSNLAEFTILLEAFKEQKLLIPDSVFAGGVSMGGITATMLLAQHPEIKAAACLMGTPSPNTYLKAARARLFAENALVLKDYDQLFSWVKNYDLNEHPETLGKRPLFFWHGTADERIPFSETADFYEKYQSDYQLVLEVGKGKTHLLEPDIMEKTAEFFAKYR